MGGFSWAVVIMYYILGAGAGAFLALWKCPYVFTHPDRLIVYSVLFGLITLGGGLGGLVQTIPGTTPDTYVIPAEEPVNTRASIFAMSCSIAVGVAFLAFALYRHLAPG
jgi:hypothetical protein